MKKNFLKNLNLPDKPGVYFFLKEERILYIGKATSLKDRTKSYFSNDLINTRGPLIVDMVFKADELKWQETESVLEALILEANLIKKHQPYYNTKEKDDKSFNYVCITSEEPPKVLVVRGRNIKNPKIYSKMFGPYPNGMQLREALKIIRKIFPFLDEKSKLNHEFYRQLNLVPNLNEKKNYLNNIKNIKLLFEGKKKRIIFGLKREMNTLAKEQKFEEANRIKRQIFALGHINDVALIKQEESKDSETFDLAPFFGRKQGGKVGPSDTKVSLSSWKNQPRIEAYDIAHMSGKDMVGVMVVLEDGEVNKNEYRKFKIKTQTGANDTGALAEVLERRFAHPEWRFPDLIVIDGSTAQINTANKIIKSNNINTEVVAVTKDDKHKAKEIKGSPSLIKRFNKEILLANSEAHRFAITFHKKLRSKSFLNN